MSPNTPSHWLQRYHLLIFDEIDSTNEEAKRLAHAEVDGDFVIWAKEQNAGRGRQGRTWHSPLGNMYMSLLHKWEHPVEDAAQIAFVVAVALGEVIKGILPKGKTLSYKWPNDILIDGKKVGGILLESHMSHETKKIEWLIVGIGINVLNAPTEVTFPATCFSAENITMKVETVIDQCMVAIDAWISKWEKEGFTPVREAWLNCAHHREQAMTVLTERDRISGVFEDMDSKGALILRLAGGQVCRVYGGEVFFETGSRDTA